MTNESEEGTKESAIQAKKQQPPPWASQIQDRLHHCTSKKLPNNIMEKRTLQVFRLKS